SRARLAYIAQIAVTGKNDALFRWQRRMPRRFAGHGADPFGQLFVAQRRSVGIKLGELVKLDDGAAHHKAAPRVALRFSLRIRITVRNNLSLLVSKDGGISERERIAMEIKSRSVAGPSERSGKENRCKTTARSTVPQSHEQLRTRSLIISR